MMMWVNKVCVCCSCPIFILLIKCHHILYNVVLSAMVQKASSYNLDAMTQIPLYDMSRVEGNKTFANSKFNRNAPNRYLQNHWKLWPSLDQELLFSPTPLHPTN